MNAGLGPCGPKHLLLANLGHRGVRDRQARWWDRPACLLCRGCGSRRSACWRADPRAACKRTWLSLARRNGRPHRRRPPQCCLGRDSTLRLGNRGAAALVRRSGSRPGGGGEERDGFRGPRRLPRRRQGIESERPVGRDRAPRRPARRRLAASSSQFTSSASNPRVGYGSCASGLVRLVGGSSAPDVCGFRSLRRRRWRIQPCCVGLGTGGGRRLCHIRRRCGALGTRRRRRRWP